MNKPTSNHADAEAAARKAIETVRNVCELDYLDIFTLSSGDARLQWPRRVTAEDAAELKEWLALVVRKIERCAVQHDTTPIEPVTQ